MNVTTPEDPGSGCPASSMTTSTCPKTATNNNNNPSGNKTELSETAFRLAEKRYKLFRLDTRASKRQSVEESDFSDVIDFQNLDANTPSNRTMMRLVSEIELPLSAEDREDLVCGNATLLETKRHRAEPATSSTSDGDTMAGAAAATRTQRCYTFDGVPGLLFFPQALTERDQRYWATQALDRYAQSPPFPNNLTTLDPTLVTARYGGPHHHSGTIASEGSNETTPATQRPAKEKMRWATLGFKYNWTTKSYSPSEYCLFPADLSKMIKETFFTMLAPVASSAMGPVKDAAAVALATAKAVDLAKGLQAPCKLSGCTQSEGRNSGTNIDNAEEMISIGGMFVRRSDLGAVAPTLFSSGACGVNASPANGEIQSVTSNPNNLPAAAPITLLANAVAASHRAISDEEILAALLSPSYEPQTAIVNYFPVGTMMCAHQDLSEPCLHRPLISVSLGSSAVFLMGSTSREDTPHAFLLRSGDLIAFTGPSRVAFHAVPRVLEDCPSHLIAHDARMKGLRININVRQVYDENQPQLADAI